VVFSYAVSDETFLSTQYLLTSFVVPSPGTAVLTFDMFVNSYGPIVIGGDLTTSHSNEYGRVDLMSPGAGALDTGSGVLLNLFAGGNFGNAPYPYSHYSFDISSVVGSGGTFQLRFATVEGNQSQNTYLNLGVDNVSIQFTSSVPEPPTRGEFLVGTIILALAGGLRKKFQKLNRIES
jgi:hypothetical protein